MNAPVESKNNILFNLSEAFLAHSIRITLSTRYSVLSCTSLSFFCFVDSFDILNLVNK